MKKVHQQILGLSLIFLLFGSIFLVSCNLPVLQQQQPVETISKDEIFTSVALTIVADYTKSAQEEQVKATMTQPVPLPPLQTNTLEPPTQSPSTATPEPTNSETPTLSPTPTEIPGAIFEDNFSNSNGWYKYTGDEYGFKYVKETYHIYNKILNAAIWSIRDVNYHNIKIEVDGKRVDGPDDGYYGVVCRLKDEGDNYYALVIGDDGFYGIGRMKDGEFEFLEDGIDEKGIINQGKNHMNRVCGVCNGKRLTLFANGEELLQVIDNTFNSGNVGMVVGNKLSGVGMEVEFDNFAILNP